jgi:hypothetical protein
MLRGVADRFDLHVTLRDLSVRSARRATRRIGSIRMSPSVTDRFDPHAAPRADAG